jgi:hypothetical protein
MSSSRSSKKTECTEEHWIRALAVALILQGKTEDATRILSRYYKIPAPRIVIGARGRYDIYGCYDPRRREICLRDGDVYMNPFVVLHEFYHHLRSVQGRRGGIEKYADKYAVESINYYKEGCLVRND